MAVKQEAKAWLDTYHGEKAVWLQAGPYEAALLPEIGGNLIALRDVERGYKLLHEPGAEEMEAFKKFPAIHGIPVLFPPNRFEDGTFTLNGRTYQFPINEEERNNHLHGFLYEIPWQVADYGADDDRSFVEIVQRVDEAHSAYKYFPHAFRFRIRYTLSAEGLLQEAEVTNEGGEAMPCMVAFHTAVNAPFVPGGDAADYRFKMTIGERWEMSERMLPTGRFQPLTDEERAMAHEGVYPFFDSMDNHYTSAPVDGRNLAILTDTRQGVRLVYETDAAFKQWMIWNNGATPGFFCPEPQTVLVNAPNTSVPLEKTGLVMLQPGEVWKAESRLYVENSK